MMAQRATEQGRTCLQADWFLGEDCIGTADGEAVPEVTSWLPISGPVSVAAALRELNLWSLDGAERRFDASDWCYAARFTVPPAAPGERLVLGFDGLATLARVWLNGELLLASNSMFITHEREVTHLLIDGCNELLLLFSSLDGCLATLKKKRPRWKAPMISHQQLRWFRTTLLGRTPGWSPPAAVVGPLRNVWLERRPAAFPLDVQCHAMLEEQGGVVHCSLTMPRSGCGIHSVVLQLERHGQCFAQSLQASGEAGHFDCRLVIQHVALWWPHTHGEPALYAATLRYSVAGSSEPVVLPLRQLGFRSVAMVTDHGRFGLQINGVQIFCRGACWTPLDPVSLRTTPAGVRIAIAQVRSMGMNMLRLPGTMVYEEDHFYDECDQQGVLVWQDFMFANMDYPSDDAEFLDSVQLEVTQQLQRFQARPSIAVLCGNSEVGQQAAMWGASQELWAPELFEGKLATLCAELAPAAIYVPSSAWGGWFPHQPDAGTSSYYGVGAYLRPVGDARCSGVKFATECLAFANVPAEQTIRRMPGGASTRVHHPGWKSRTPRDLGAGWDFDDVRDHYLATLFDTDPARLRYSDYSRYLTLSRMATAEVMGAAFSQWRLPDSVCGGALVLFLRDLWAGAGWGIVDDIGFPKSCFFALKRVLQPVAVLLSDGGLSGLAIHVLNESGIEIDVLLELSAWRDGKVQVARASKALRVGARASQTLSALDLVGYFVDLTNAYRFGPIVCDAVVVKLSAPDGKVLGRACYFPQPWNERPETDIGLRAKGAVIDEDTAEVIVTTERLALGIHFDVPGFCPEDDYFHLAPGDESKVILRRTGEGSFAGSISAVNSLAEARLVMTDRQPSPLQVEQLL